MEEKKEQWVGKKLDLKVSEARASSEIKQNHGGIPSISVQNPLKYMRVSMLCMSVA